MIAEEESNIVPKEETETRESSSEDCPKGDDLDDASASDHVSRESSAREAVVVEEEKPT